MRANWSCVLGVVATTAAGWFGCSSFTAGPTADGGGANGEAGTSGSDEGGTCSPDPLPPPPTGSCPCDACEPGTNVCVFNCVGEKKCELREIQCPANYACKVECEGVDACDRATVRCPSPYACTLVCDGFDACGDLSLYCGKASCSVRCLGDPQSCSGTNVYCGKGKCGATCAGGAATPTLDRDAGPCAAGGC